MFLKCAKYVIMNSYFLSECKSQSMTTQFEKELTP